MRTAEELKRSNDSFRKQLKPLVEAYEKETGLIVDSIRIRQIEAQRLNESDIKIRTNADTL